MSIQPDAQLAPRILVAVADQNLRHAASTTLRAHGYSVSATTEQDAAVTLARSFSPDIMVVDLSLQMPDGQTLFEVLRSMTEAYVIALADLDDTRVQALREGADDVVGAGTSPDELAARCHALMRRPRSLNSRWDPSQASLIDLGVLTVDVGRKELRVHGVDVPATRIEFALFEQLCRRPSEVCSRQQLIEAVWGPHWVGDTHVVDVHLSNLRRKLQQHAPGLRFVHTVRGVGFRLSNDLLRTAGGGDDRTLASA